MRIHQSTLLTEDYILAINTLLFRAKNKGLHINKTKLQKLLYLWYRQCLKTGESQTPLISIDPKSIDSGRNQGDIFRAWTYGPVVLEIMRYFDWRELKPIINKDSGAATYYEEKQQGAKYQKMMDNLNYVLDTYGNYTASYLTEITHLDNSPYANTLLKDGPYERIKDKYIKEYN